MSSFPRPCLTAQHICHNARRLCLTASVSASAIILSLGLGGIATAQTTAVAQDPARLSAPEPAGDSERTFEAVTVTGSRIARSGYESPTPLTVLGQDEIDARAPANVADFVNEIPSVVGGRL